MERRGIYIVRGHTSNVLRQFVQASFVDRSKAVTTLDEVRHACVLTENLRPQPLLKPTFSEHARERLLELYNKHDHEVGRVLKEEHPELYKAFTPTDCITYALNVITYAYKKTNNDEAARQVKKLGAHGHRVSEYLVTKQRWVGVYISPDVTHPVDASREHTFANQLVNKTCTYYQVPIKYRVVDYNPTPKDDPNFQKLNKKAPETSLNQVDLEALAKVPFGFGTSRGGMHTWLFSFGSLYEVHWDGIGSSLYERTPLEVFGWLSGAIVVPPDQANQLSCLRKRAVADKTADAH